MRSQRIKHLSRIRKICLQSIDIHRRIWERYKIQIQDFVSLFQEVGNHMTPCFSRTSCEDLEWVSGGTLTVEGEFRQSSFRLEALGWLCLTWCYKYQLWDRNKLGKNEDLPGDSTSEMSEMIAPWQNYISYVSGSDISPLSVWRGIPGRIWKTSLKALRRWNDFVRCSLSWYTCCISWRWYTNILLWNLILSMCRDLIGSEVKVCDSISSEGKEEKWPAWLILPSIFTPAFPMTL